MNLKYIPVKEDDRQFYIDLHHTSYRETIETMFGWDESLQDSYASKSFDNETIYIVFHGDARIGVVGWEDRCDHIWLSSFYILPKFQGRGYGSQILDELINKGKTIKLRTLKANMRAKNLYKRKGFYVSDTSDIHWLMEYKT